MLDPLGLAIGCMPLVGPKSPAGSHEIQQVTYSADVGLWKIKSDGGALPFDVDALSLGAEISVAHGYECTVSVAVAGSNRSYTITFAAMGPVPLLAPVNESLQTSASASPNLSVTTQGAEAQVATREVVSIAGSGLGDETIDNHGNRVTLSGDGSSVDSWAAGAGWTSGSAVGTSVTFTRDAVGSVETFKASGGGEVTVLSEGLDAVPAVTEVVQIDRGAANYGTLSVNGSSFAWDSAASDVAIAVNSVLTGRSVSCSGLGSPENPWILTYSSAGAQGDLSITSHTLESRSDSGGTLSVSRIHGGS